MRACVSTVLFVAVAAVAAVASPLGADAHRTLRPSPRAQADADAPVGAAGSLSFQAFGDWGMGNADQAAVAKAMEVTAEQRGTQMVINVGDNSYISALDPAGHRQGGFSSIHDPLWAKYFSSAYTGAKLSSMPFYSVLGNHDYMGNASCQLGPAGYHSIDKRWVMPDYNYTMRVPLNGAADGAVDATFIFLDTSPFISSYYTSPENPKMAAQLAHRDYRTQLAWLQTELQAAASRPGPIIVVGHHPVVTGQKLPEGVKVDMGVIKPLLEQYKATAYICGHVHLLGFGQLNGVGYVVTGAGATGKVYEDDPTAAAEAYDVPVWTSGAAGVVSLSLNASALDVTFLATNQSVLAHYSVAVPARS